MRTKQQRESQKQQRESQKQQKEIIKSKLKQIFKNHVGSENAINSHDLFKEVFNREPNDLSIYEASFFWNVIKSVLRELRGEEELFIVNSANSLYVLKTQEEANHFKRRIDGTITALENLKVKSQRWIDRRKWR